jgi:sec-independent protein translocase protein TatC
MAAEQINEPIPLHPDRPYHGGAEMTLLEHLKELRNRVIVCAAAVVLGTIVSFVFWHDILGWLLAPAREDHPDFRLIANSPTESIGIAIKIGLYGGLTIASPVVAYELLAFIVPGLTPKERRILLPGMLAVVGFLLLGMAFAYWIIMPRSLGFLLDFGGEEITPLITAEKYISFATRIIFWVGVAFELPVVLALAARLGLVRARQLLKFWRYAVIIIFIIAAVITPTPDPYNQSLVAGPLFFLYFVGILFAWILQPRRKRIEAVS